MSKNITNIFHVAIITLFLLTATGCGYKGDPVYVEEKKESTK